MAAYGSGARYDGKGHGGFQGGQNNDSQHRGGYNSNKVANIKVPTEVNITSNLYKYLGGDIVLHQYAVTFVPEILDKFKFTKFLKLVEENDFKLPYAYDGVGILVLKEEFKEKTLKMMMKEGDELICKISHKQAHYSKNTNDNGFFQCVEIVMRYYQKLNYLVDKKKMYPLDFSSATPIDNLLTIQQGLISTLKFTKFGYYCNLDMVHGVFYQSKTLIELLRETIGGGKTNDSPINDMGSEFYNKFDHMIRNLRVNTTHRERNGSFKIEGILNQPASEVKFEIEGRMWTVADYFEKTYGRKLKYPRLPVIVQKKGSLVMHLPMEVLKICPNQKYLKKLDESQTALMIRVAAKQPHLRFKHIGEKAKDICALQNNLTKEFGLVFDNKMLNCKATRLPAPQVKFLNSKMEVNNGSWNLIGCTALSGVTIDNWTIFTFRSNNDVSSNDIRGFTAIAAKYGINFKSSPKKVLVTSTTEFFNAPKSPFNLVILPDRSAARYDEIKRICETYQSCITQCMLAKNLCKFASPSFASNLLLKINAKLGGKNWALQSPILQEKSTIIFGIDVSHPGAADTESPSLVSIVASLDYNFINYKTIIEQQDRRQEIVTNLKDYVKTMLRAHFTSTKVKPDRLIIFRDGVGDSMFDAVYLTEISAIEEACKDLDSTYSPEINFIVAQKRHNIRFATASDHSNLAPGTVVDEVGNPELTDFFLVSQNAIQGTARPVRYLVLRNDSKFSRMEIYTFVYHLCHLYARATKSVSVVPPIYYADLGAGRGKCYLEKNKEGVLVMRACNKDISKNLFYL